MLRRPSGNSMLEASEPRRAGRGLYASRRDSGSCQFLMGMRLTCDCAFSLLGKVTEALECLDQQWPEWARGRSWRAAGRTCRDALDGWRSARDARRAFLKAAKRAGLTAPEARSSHTSRPLWPIDGLQPETTFSGWQ